MSCALASLLSAIDGRVQRDAALDAWLAERGPAEMVVALETCWRAACGGRADARAATIILAPWLLARVESGARATLARAAEDAGLGLATALLQAGSARRVLPGRAWTGELRIASFVSLVRAPGDPVRAPCDPMPRRWARLGLGRHPGWRTFHAANVHRGRLPAVLELLDAPTLSSRTVVGMANERPLLPEVAAALARHDRWWAEAAVRAALLANPFTPAALVLPMLPAARRRDVEGLARGGGIVARGARAVLDARLGR